MTAPEAQLGRRDLGAIADLCRHALTDPPTAEELEGALFTEDQPAVVLGDPGRGVVAVVDCDDGPHVRLLVVDEQARGQGVGHSLLAAAEDWARGAGHSALLTGADPPYFLWPGVPSTETGLLYLLERRHYSRAETNFNMAVDLTAIPEDPGGYELAGPEDAEEIDEWMATHWSNWRPEALRALRKGNLVVAGAQREPAAA